MKLRPLAALAVASTLSVAVLALPAAPVSAADAAPGSTGADWISGQLQNGLVHGSYVDTFTDPENPTVVQYVDYGLSVDIALALDAVDASDPTADAISDALAADIESYVSSSDGVVVGSLAKAAVLAQTVGDDATSYGGRNLIADLASRVVDTGPSQGRAFNDGFDYANTIVQTFAAQALDGAGNGEADEALTYLLKQQCTAGFFAGTLPADAAAADQTCNGRSAEASIDATALVVIALQSVGGPAVDDAVSDALDWLASQQQADGTVGDTPNANTTGLAGWAFGVSGRTARAADAATWLRQHQVADPGSCSRFPAALVGAVALDDTGYTNLENGMQVHDETAEVRRATAQALPALVYAPAGGTAVIKAARGFVRAGTKQPITVTGLAPGDAVCVGGNRQAVSDDAGRATVKVTPSGTRTIRYTVVRSAGTIGNAVLHVLGTQRLGVTVADASVRKGASQVVTVSKLQPREKYVIRVGGEVVKSGKAGPKGQAQVRFPATGRPGTVAVTAVGQFPSIRKGADSFRITR